MEGDARRMAPILAALAGLVGLNIGLNFFNAWALKREGEGPQFHFPLFYTMAHMLATVLGSLVVIGLKKPSSGWPSFLQFRENGWRLLLIASCSTTNVACNNLSLTLISLFLNQVIKATAPLPTMVFSWALERRRYGLSLVLVCALIVLGTMLAIPTSRQTNETETSTSTLGVVVVIISTIAASLKPVIMSLVFRGAQDKPKLEPTVVLFYDSFISVWLLLLVWLVVADERVGTIAYIGSRTWTALGILAAGATMAFFFNLSVYFFIKFTSALTSTVASNATKVINIILAAIVANTVHDFRNLVGIVLVCVSIMIYSCVSQDSEPGPSKPLAAQFFKKDPESGSKVSEDTPLNPSRNLSAQCCVIS